MNHQKKKSKKFFFLRQEYVENILPTERVCFELRLLIVLSFII